MLLTRSSAWPDAGSRAFGALRSGMAGLSCSSMGAGSGFSQVLGAAFLASSALWRHMLRILASLRGPHLRRISICWSKYRQACNKRQGTYG
jgi:hypothetical protein